ncbi:unnamed protein product [Trichogramma brassicae]|uniref:Uncharacterized protein n=1 Tax=Trichogramma brassicae TaxID=86971 RepID=A0A6H5IWD3_9HYME|nr:unnamed protein product [Trichogramma brassicae]
MPSTRIYQPVKMRLLESLRSWLHSSRVVVRYATHRYRAEPGGLRREPSHRASRANRAHRDNTESTEEETLAGILQEMEADITVQGSNRTRRRPRKNSLSWRSSPVCESMKPGAPSLFVRLAEFVSRRGEPPELETDTTACQLCAAAYEAQKEYHQEPLWKRTLSLLNHFSSQKRFQHRQRSAVTPNHTCLTLTEYERMGAKPK